MFIITTFHPQVSSCHAQLNSPRLS
jgi:hypothetical protein